MAARAVARAAAVRAVAETVAVKEVAVRVVAVRVAGRGKFRARKQRRCTRPPSLTHPANAWWPRAPFWLPGYSKMYSKGGIFFDRVQPAADSFTRLETPVALGRTSVISPPKFSSKRIYTATIDTKINKRCTGGWRAWAAPVQHLCDCACQSCTPSLPPSNGKKSRNSSQKLVRSYRSASPSLPSSSSRGPSRSRAPRCSRPCRFG